MLGKLVPFLNSSLVTHLSDPLNLYVMLIGSMLYSSTWKLERFAAKGQVTSRYDGINVSLPITIVEPR